MFIKNTYLKEKGIDAFRFDEFEGFFKHSYIINNYAIDKIYDAFIENPSSYNTVIILSCTTEEGINVLADTIIAPLVNNLGLNRLPWWRKEYSGRLKPFVKKALRYCGNLYVDYCSRRDGDREVWQWVRDGVSMEDINRRYLARRLDTTC